MSLTEAAVIGLALLGLAYGIHLWGERQERTKKQRDLNDRIYRIDRSARW